MRRAQPPPMAMMMLGCSTRSATQPGMRSCTTPMMGTIAWSARPTPAAPTPIRRRPRTSTMTRSPAMWMIVNPRGATTTFHYATAGKPDRVTDALGNVTTYAYDSRGRVIQMTAPGGLTTTYTYTGADLLASITRTYRTLALGSTTPTERSERIDYRYTPEGWLAYQS